MADPDAVRDYLWVAKWAAFQHYAPDPARGPAWIKDYTAQMDDDRYLELTDRQRALLADLRRIFATTRGRLPDDSRTITRHRHRQTRDDDIKALVYAGFVEVVSRQTLEIRLEELYSRSKNKRKPLSNQNRSKGTPTTLELETDPLTATYARAGYDPNDLSPIAPWLDPAGTGLGEKHD